MALLNSAGLKGNCPICGAEDMACGGPSSSVPIDLSMQEAIRMTGPASVIVEGPGKRERRKFTADAAERFVAANPGAHIVAAPTPEPEPVAPMVASKMVSGPPENKAMPEPIKK